MIILLVIVIIFLHMCLIWLWYRYTNNPSVVDVGWASGLTLAGLVYLNNQEPSLRFCCLAWHYLYGESGLEGIYGGHEYALKK